MLVIGVEEAEGALLLPSAVALKLRLTPTPPQICCAKASTSAERELSRSVKSLERASLLASSLRAMGAPVRF